MNMARSGRTIGPAAEFAQPLGNGASCHARVNTDQLLGAFALRSSNSTLLWSVSAYLRPKSLQSELSTGNCGPSSLPTSVCIDRRSNV